MLLAVLAVAGAAAMAGDAAMAEISARDDGERKINLSGRQRMLTQFMAKATCLAARGIDKARNKNSVASTHWLFDSTLSGLQNGDPVNEMLPEAHAGVVAKLTEVKGLWQKLSPAVLAAIQTDFADQAPLDTIRSTNLTVLDKMNEAVSLIEATYSSEGTVDPQIAAALNVAGRQRMLTQKATKEFCYVVSGLDVADNRARLKTTIELFNASLVRLQKGDASGPIPPPPAGEIADQLDVVARGWAPLEEIFARVAGGATATDADVLLISNRNEDVLSEMNKAVSLYELIGM